MSGVRSWWDASATNPRCSVMSRSSRRAIVFMVSPRTAISGGAEGSGSAGERSPVAKRAAAASRSRSGLVTERAMAQPMPAMVISTTTATPTRPTQ